MKLIAHRGYKTKLIKENTIEAFNNAINNDFIGIECDARTTKDNHIVICHDAFINRVSNGSGFIKKYTYDDLLNYNFGTSNIPLLKDVLNSYKCIKLIELKTRIDMNDIIEYIDDNTYFISFDSKYMFELKNKYPKLKFGVLNYVLNSKDNYNLDAICLLEQVLTPELIDHFLSRGIKVFVYGISKHIKYIDDRLYYIVDFKGKV